MSDFDTVLERLLVDPAFQAALAANPSAALAGYTLAPDERELLGAQVVAGAGEDRTVELRTSKSGVVGLLGPVAAAFGVAAGASGHETLGSGPTQSFGGGPTQSFGHIPASEGGNFSGPTETFGTTGSQSFGGGTTAGQFGSTPVEAVDYHTHVDVDGDGKWDAYTAYQRPDGGVDIDVDVNHDGRVDFVGHDLNRDGLVDSADFDNNHDGVFDTRMYDDNGDGWMDRSEAIPPPAGPSGAAAPAPEAPTQSWGDVPTS